MENKRKIFFRADASAQIGYGHFIRTLALADMLREDFDCTFFTQSPSEYQQKEAEKVCPLIALSSDDSKFDKFLEYLTGDEIVVLDNYFFTSAYQKQIKDKGCKLVCIDDMHDKHYYADVVINHGLTDESLFDTEPYTRLCLGLDYALLRKPFLQKVDETKREKGHWFICFGGSDYDNLTEKFARLLDSHDKVQGITIVIGDAYSHIDSFQSLKKVAVKKNLSAQQMCEEMEKAEYAVLPTSSVCVEALSRGCKVASGYYVKNQMEAYGEFVKNQSMLPLGCLYEVSSHLFVDEIMNFNISKSKGYDKIPIRYINTFKKTCK